MPHYIFFPAAIDYAFCCHEEIIYVAAIIIAFRRAISRLRD